MSIEAQTPPRSRREARQGAGAPKRERSLLSFLGTAVVGSILVIVLGVAFAAIGLPAMTGSTALTVLTSSMEPSLPPGTMVVVRPTDPEEIEPGDVVTYQLRSGEATVVTHRVTQKLRTTGGEPLFITRGDNNPTPDPEPVRAVQIRGKVWYAIPLIGYVSVGFTGQLRMWVIPVAVVLLFGYAAWMILSWNRDRRRARRA